MKSKCPVDYELKNCSSSNYGLTCEICFHKDDETFEVMVDAYTYKI